MKTITGTWKDANGNPILGVLHVKLMKPGVALGTTQVSACEIVIQLDSTGSIPAGTQIWATDELSPSGLQYKLYVTAPRTADGPSYLVWGPVLRSIAGASPISLD